MNHLISMVLGCAAGAGAMWIGGKNDKGKANQLESRLQEANQSIERYRQRLEESERRCEELSKNLERQRQEARKQENEKDDIDDSLFRLQQENKKLKRDVELLSRDLAEYKSLVKSLRGK